MDKFCTDGVKQLMYYKTQGYFSDILEVYAELSEVVSVRKPDLERTEEHIMSMNLGLAIEDRVTAKLVYEEVKKKGVELSSVMIFRGSPSVF